MLHFKERHGSFFPIFKVSAQKKLVEIRNPKSVPSSSADEISRENRQIKRKQFFGESSEFDTESTMSEKEAESDRFNNDGEI